MKLKQQTIITYIYMGVVSVFIKKMQFLIYVFLKAWYAYRRTYFSELGYVRVFFLALGENIARIARESFKIRILHTIYELLLTSMN